MAMLLRLVALHCSASSPCRRVRRTRRKSTWRWRWRIDISGSIDPDEAKLQREGYVKAFRDPVIIKAILGGSHGRIAVAYFEWSDAWVQKPADRLDPARLRGGDRGLRHAARQRADLDRAPHLDQRRHPLRHPAVRPQPLRSRAQGARHLGRRLEQRRRPGDRHALRGAEGAHRHQRPADHERPAQPVRLPERNRPRQVLPALRHRRAALLRRGRRATSRTFPAPCARSSCRRWPTSARRPVTTSTSATRAACATAPQLAQGGRRPRARPTTTTPASCGPSTSWAATSASGAAASSGSAASASRRTDLGRTFSG